MSDNLWDYTPNFMQAMDDDISQYILAYLPDAEIFSLPVALELAELKDKEAADVLLQSLIEGGVL